MTPDGSTVYMANSGANTVSVVATATTKATATIPISGRKSRILRNAKREIRVGDEIPRLREKIGLESLMCAPLSHQSFMLMTEKVLPRIA